MHKKKIGLLGLVSLLVFSVNAQITDTAIAPTDTTKAVKELPLRIINLSPYFTIHVDSILSYQFEINKEQSKYFWYLKNSPVGLRIGKDNGLLTFKAEKSLFKSGRLKYDIEYQAKLGVQSLSNPLEKTDTSVTIVFYNTEVIASKIKPAVASTVTVDEGEKISFQVLCETGSFPIEDILISYDLPIANHHTVAKCGDEFSWIPPFDFIKETEKDKIKMLTLSFIGTDKFNTKDTAIIKVMVKDALNYPFAIQEFNQTIKDIDRYIIQLKYTFLILDKQLKKTKRTRNGFDITAASTALTGTILSTSTSEGSKNAGKVLPSVGVALVPVKEAAAPNKNIEQNQATLIRSAIKRLEYMKTDYNLVGEKDLTVAVKTAKLKEELKQTRVQLADVSADIIPNISEEELNRYFNSKKVNKKYLLRKI